MARKLWADRWRRGHRTGTVVVGGCLLAVGVLVGWVALSLIPMSASEDLDFAGLHHRDGLELMHIKRSDGGPDQYHEYLLRGSTRDVQAALDQNGLLNKLDSAEPLASQLGMDTPELHSIRSGKDDFRSGGRFMQRDFMVGVSADGTTYLFMQVFA